MTLEEYKFLTNDHNISDKDFSKLKELMRLKIIIKDSNRNCLEKEHYLDSYWVLREKIGKVKRNSISNKILK